MASSQDILLRNYPILGLFLNGFRTIDGTELNELFSALIFAISETVTPTPDVRTANSITIGADDAFIVMNKAVSAPTSFFLPAVATRAGLPLMVQDWAGNAGDMTFTPHGTETIGGLSSWVVGSGGVPGSGGFIKLIPSEELNGWLPQS